MNLFQVEMLFLLFLAGYDTRTKMLPNIIMLPAIVFFSVINGTWVFTLFSLLLGSFIYSRTLFGQNISEGDVKLICLIGAMFGWMSPIIGLLTIITISVIRYFTGERRPLAFTPFMVLTLSLCLLSDKLLTAIVR